MEHGGSRGVNPEQKSWDFYLNEVVRVDEALQSGNTAHLVEATQIIVPATQGVNRAGGGWPLRYEVIYDTWWEVATPVNKPYPESRATLD